MPLKNIPPVAPRWATFSYLSPRQSLARRPSHSLDPRHGIVSLWKPSHASPWMLLLLMHVPISTTSSSCLCTLFLCCCMLSLFCIYFCNYHTFVCIVVFVIIPVYKIVACHPTFACLACLHVFIYWSIIYFNMYLFQLFIFPTFIEQN